MAEVDVRYLISELRLYLYDMETPYEYTDEVLGMTLFSAVKALARKWHNRYIPSTDYMVSRNAGVMFSVEEPPVIEPMDETAIILQASIILKTARVYNSVWDVVSWRDDEVAFSNIQSAKSLDYSIQRDLDELNALLGSRKLHSGKYVSLPGFHKNTTETGI